MSAADGRPYRVVRVIARLNIGGPSIQAVMLTSLLAERGYETVLVRGREGAFEGNMDYLAHEQGVRPVDVPQLRREPSPADVGVVRTLIALLRSFRPDILHTHAAKAGTVGRIAALLAPAGRPRVTVHTFHGHSLEGYFSRPAAAAFLAIERFLASRTTQLIAVSPEVRNDLVRLRVAPPEKIRVVPLGLPLDEFARARSERAERRRELRHELGIPEEAPLVTLIARLVPIKRVDRFLAAAAAVTDERMRFLVVGDGELRESLRRDPNAARLGDRLVWAGFRRDIPAVCAGSDVVALTSDNEGTPVSLIEAQAAGVPVVSTRVGGAETVVRDGETGFVAEADPGDLAEAIERILSDPDLAARMGDAGHRHAMREFSLRRLVDDIDALYRELLAA